MAPTQTSTQLAVSSEALELSVPVQTLSAVSNGRESEPSAWLAAHAAGRRWSESWMREIRTSSSMRGRRKRATAQRACALLYRSPWLVSFCRETGKNGRAPAGLVVKLRLSCFIHKYERTQRICQGIKSDLIRYFLDLPASVRHCKRVGTGAIRHWRRGPECTSSQAGRGKGDCRGGSCGGSSPVRFLVLDELGDAH